MADVPLDTVLEHVKRARGFDFTGYKRASLERRVALRMQAVAAEDYGAYLDVLEVDTDEFAHLFDTLLINVTAFFRDAPAWDFMASTVLPRLLGASRRAIPSGSGAPAARPARRPTRWR